MVRPKLGGGVSWGRGSARTAGAGGPDAGAAAAAGAADARPAVPQLNHFSNDGSFLKGFERRDFLYGSSAAEEAPAEEAPAEEAPAEEAPAEEAPGAVLDRRPSK
jgi:hypothetical protein